MMADAQPIAPKNGYSVVSITHEVVDAAELAGRGAYDATGGKRVWATYGIHWAASTQISHCPS